jgi:short-subunit dehydrogenase
MPTRYENALITGASSGLGRGLALWFAARGSRVFACGRREAELRSLHEEAARAGGRVEAVALDVADTERTVARIREIDSSCGGLDLVVANAGVGLATSARKLKWENVEQTLKVNVLGAAATLCAALPGMVERDRGHLVGISSIAAYRGLPRMAAYCGSKAFLATFLESLRVDLQGTGVKVSSIHPGYVKTEMTAQNKSWMPLLMEADAAVDRMGKAILRQPGEYAFPWPMGVAFKGLRMVPNALYDVASRRRRRSR